MEPAAQLTTRSRARRSVVDEDGARGGRPRRRGLRRSPTGPGAKQPSPTNRVALTAIAREAAKGHIGRGRREPRPRGRYAEQPGCSRGSRRRARAARLAARAGRRARARLTAPARSRSSGSSRSTTPGLPTTGPRPRRPTSPTRTGSSTATSPAEASSSIRSPTSGRSTPRRRARTRRSRRSSRLRSSRAECPSRAGARAGSTTSTMRAATRRGSPASRRPSPRRRWRARRDRRHGRRSRPRRGGPRGLPHDPRPARAADRLRAVDPPLQLQPRGRPERTAPVDDLACRLRKVDLRRAGLHACGPSMKEAAAKRAPELQHGVLVVLRAPGGAVAAELPDLRDPAPPEPVEERPAVRGRRDRHSAASRRSRPRSSSATSGAGSVHFWVSKPSSVRVAALGRERSLAVSGGWHTLTWALPARAGVFPGHDPCNRLGRQLGLGGRSADRPRRLVRAQAQAASKAGPEDDERVHGPQRLAASARGRRRPRQSLRRARSRPSRGSTPRG